MHRRLLSLHVPKSLVANLDENRQKVCSSSSRTPRDRDISRPVCSLAFSYQVYQSHLSPSSTPSTQGRLPLTYILSTRRLTTRRRTPHTRARTHYDEEHVDTCTLLVTIRRSTTLRRTARNDCTQPSITTTLPVPMMASHLRSSGLGGA